MAPPPTPRTSYYVCRSLMKRRSGTCDSPRLNIRRFEEPVVGQIRPNILTGGNIRELAKVVDQEMVLNGSVLSAVKNDGLECSRQ